MLRLIWFQHNRLNGINLVCLCKSEREKVCVCVRVCKCACVCHSDWGENKGETNASCLTVISILKKKKALTSKYFYICVRPKLR